MEKLLIVVLVLILLFWRSCPKRVEGYEVVTYNDNLVKQLYYYIISGKAHPDDIIHMYINDKNVYTTNLKSIINIVRTGGFPATGVVLNNGVRITVLNIMELMINGHTQLDWDNHNPIHMMIVNTRSSLNNNCRVYKAADSAVQELDQTHSNSLDMILSNRYNKGDGYERYPPYH